MNESDFNRVERQAEPIADSRHDRELCEFDRRQDATESESRKYTECPKCDSDNIDYCYHRATWSIPECNYWQCYDCDHQWDIG